MNELSRFNLGIIALVAAAGALISGVYATLAIGVIPLLVFGVKSFVLGVCTGVAAKKKMRILVSKSHFGEKKYKEVDNPEGVWFILGFGAVLAVLSVLLVAGLLTITSTCVFLFGVMLVYSDAVDEIVDSREFAKGLAYLVIFLSAAIRRSYSS